MSQVDAVTLADKAVRLGLISPQQAQDAWEDLGGKMIPSTELLRWLERRGLLTPLQSKKLVKGDQDGYYLGGYRLLYKIASGSFGRVFRADEPSTGRVVAIKILRGKWTEDKHKVELFLREGRMGMTLHHPNIVEILAVSHDRASNQYFIVMEFVEGGNLRDFLHIRQRLMPHEVVKILDDTTSALAYAFTHAVTHRDMKLTNILLSSQGTAKLVDFGLAGGQLGFEEKSDVAVDRTVDYAGLEKATGAPSGDPRSDIFFLGCVAYELLTGRAPMDRKVRGAGRMAAHRFQGIAPMPPDAAPAVLVRLVENMMTLNPADRFQTFSQMHDRIREVRAELEGTKGEVQAGSKPSQRTIFLVERDEALQDVLRKKLKERGFRVLIASDPVRAVDRFRQQPFDLLVVDGMTTGDDGLHGFQRLMEEARKMSFPLKGIMMLGDDQLAWKPRLELLGVTILLQPVKYKQLLASIKGLFSKDKAAKDEAAKDEAAKDEG